MANRKITAMTALTAPATDDVLPIVDVSETAAADKNKKITVQELFKGVPDGTAAAPALAFESDDGNGIYLAGTDTVGISTGGTQRVTVNGSGDVSISGSLTVSGTTTTIESSTLTVDDKNIEIASVASDSFTGDIATGSADITNVSSTDNLIPGVAVAITSGGGTVTLPATTVLSVSGTTVTLNDAFTGSGTATGATLSAGGPTDVTADGGGITLKGATDKTITWVNSTTCWTFNQDVSVTSTGALKVPVGTTAQRPGETGQPTAAAGQIRRNTTTSSFEGYTGTVWAPLGGGATGGGADAWVVETDQTVTQSYELSSGKHGTTVSPTISSGATITVPSGAILVIL